ncbi:unnamed protein product [Boreogadus saida]
MILESREKSDPASGDNSEGAIIVSHLNLVDLAGSAQGQPNRAEGARFKEGCNINRSLFTLAQVIKKLSDESQRGFTNYRDSKLTRILQNSLGGNAKTVIICTITMAALEETLSTLQATTALPNSQEHPGHKTELNAFKKFKDSRWIDATSAGKESYMLCSQFGFGVSLMFLNLVWPRIVGIPGKTFGLRFVYGAAFCG